MTIKIGINPLTWTNDDLPSLGAETPLSTCLREGKQAGYAGFELGNKFPRESEALNAVLAEHELQLVSGWYSGKLLSQSVEQELADIEAHLQLLRQGGANVMVYCEVTDCIHGRQDIPVSRRPKLKPEQWSSFGQRLTQVADYCLSQGVQLAYHHHMGTVVQSESDVDLLMKHTGPALGLLLDSGHITYAGGNPVNLIKKYANRINHVHAKDIRKNILDDARNRQLSFLDAVLNGVFTVPGDGCIDYTAIFNALKECEYQGWIVVEAEQDPSIAHPLTYATLGFKNLVNTARQTGLSIEF
ncbi:myo-inosose-2 dehydratase [Lacimicrobium alkaliphilum]|uniref:Myo-inosose-2 dehydratase n=1 Tax=Lacimicrobium alkaliphilum TaxID=1526571 RepID=A0ABQ1RJ34_9ALTE|nr:myo-inosose-2 dehydratase [Lacimicrobium alkaliphilum]GGD69943.1 myo-inosose-2 dehydratase [Lacimicrobium alkaliphilum]